MIRPMSSLLLGLCLTLGAASAHSQALNTRWHGTWKSSEDTLVISEQGLRIGKDNCKWVSAKPKTTKTCVAFYDQPVAKAQLVRLIDDAEVAMKKQFADKSLKLSAADRSRMTADLARHRQLLGQISNDNFKTVATLSAEETGDCGTYYFLDKETVYLVIDCPPAPDAATLRAYRKQP